MKKTILTLFLILLIFLIGCQQQTTNKDSVQSDLSIEQETISKSDSPKEYLLDIDYNLNGATLELTGNSNLPEGSIISLYVDRNHHNIGDKDIHVGELGSSDIILKNGEFSTTIKLSDNNWFNRVKSLNDIENEKFEWISDKVNLNAIFTPMNRNQPIDVINAVGKRGEHLKGEHVEEDDIISLKTLKRSFEINYPINNNLINSLGYQVKSSEEQIEKSKSSDSTNKNNRKVTFSADKYRDGYLAIMLSIFDTNGNCDWIVGDLKLDIKSKDGSLISSKNFKSLQKSSFMCANSDSTSEIYIGSDISNVYRIDYTFTANTETYSGTLTLSGFA